MDVHAEMLRLERLLAQLQTQNAIALDVEMYDRFGGVDAAEVARFADERGYHPEERAALRARIDALVISLRTTCPEAISRWVDAHRQLLQARRLVLSDELGRGVVNSYLDQWEELRRGERTLVEESTAYVHYDPSLYRSLFASLDESENADLAATK